MKQHKKIYFAAGAATLLISAFLLAGCSSNSSSNNADNTANKNFEVATVRWSDWGTTFQNYPNELAKNAGITIKWDTYLNANWPDKSATVLASGKLPDAFIGSNAFTDQQISQNQADFIPLNKYINSTDMPNLTKLLKEQPQLKSMITNPDGKIYSLPKTSPMRPTVANQLFINKKWLDQLGLQMPTTYDEFVNVLEQFKAKIPGAVPYAPSGNVDPTFSYLLPFGVRDGAPGTNDVSIESGKVVWNYNTDNYKTGIAAMHDAYTKGLIDSGTYTENTTQMQNKTLAKNETVGVSAGWTADAVFGANAKDYAALPPLKGPDGKAYVMSDPEHYNESRNEVLVTTHAKNVKAMMKWLDSFYTEDAAIQNFYGQFGVGTQKTSDGYTVLKPTGSNSSDTQAWINSLRDFGPKAWNSVENSKVTYQDTTNGDAVKLQMDAQYKKYALPAYPNVTYSSDELKTLSTISTQLTSYATQQEALWVTKGGVDSDWSAYQKKLKDMGLDKFMKIQQDAYNRYKKSLK
ncbi:MAG: extracellular solute-binding protein [Streptococcaceae bacterium]|jgi:putative aldouronate transport system substrate-binding protein|nr:extracellular solute-binding protein [Streptococcaceae bacterium]